MAASSSDRSHLRVSLLDLIPAHAFSSQRFRAWFKANRWELKDDWWKGPDSLEPFNNAYLLDGGDRLDALSDLAALPEPDALAAADVSEPAPGSQEFWSLLAEGWLAGQRGETFH